MILRGCPDACLSYAGGAMAGEEIDFAAAGLLDGLEGADREERLALLRQLAAQGVPLEELRRNVESGRLVFLLADRVIGGPRALHRRGGGRSAAGSASSSCSPPAGRWACRSPSPAKRPSPTNDVEAARRSLVAAEAGVSEEDLLELLRVLSRGLAQAAETMRALPMKLVLRAGIGERELALHYGEAVARLYPLVDPLMSSMLASHLRHATETEIVGAAERDGGRLPGSRRVAIGFADLVGFTRLGEEVPPDELGRLATRLEAIALEVAAPPGAPGQDDRRRRDARLARARAAAGGGARPDRRRRGGGRGLPPAARRGGARRGAGEGGRLVRAAREPRQPHHLRGPAEQPAGRRLAV